MAFSTSLITLSGNIHTYILSLPQHVGEGGRNRKRTMIGWGKNDTLRKEMLQIERKAMRVWNRQRKWRKGLRY